MAVGPCATTHIQCIVTIPMYIHSNGNNYARTCIPLYIMLLVMGQVSYVCTVGSTRTCSTADLDEVAVCIKLKGSLELYCCVLPTADIIGLKIQSCVMVKMMAT